MYLDFNITMALIAMTLVIYFVWSFLLFISNDMEDKPSYKWIAGGVALLFLLSGLILQNIGANTLKESNDCLIFDGKSCNQLYLCLDKVGYEIQRNILLFMKVKGCVIPP